MDFYCTSVEPLPIELQILKERLHICTNPIASTIFSTHTNCRYTVTLGEPLLKFKKGPAMNEAYGYKLCYPDMR